MSGTARQAVLPGVVLGARRSKHGSSSPVLQHPCSSASPGSHPVATTSLQAESVCFRSPSVRAGWCLCVGCLFSISHPRLEGWLFPSLSTPNPPSFVTRPKTQDFVHVSIPIFILAHSFLPALLLDKRLQKADTSFWAEESPDLSRIQMVEFDTSRIKRHSCEFLMITL